MDSTHFHLDFTHREGQLEALPDQIIVKLEIHSAGDHEKCRNVLQDRSILRVAGILDAEAAGSDGTERVADCLKEGHPADREEQALHDRDCKVDRIEDGCGVADLRDEFSDDRTRALRLHKVECGAAEERHNGQHEYEDSHAADPVGEASPEEGAVIQRLDFRQDRSSRRREAGHGLKDRVEIVGDVPRQRERQCADQRHDEPCQRDDHETFTRIHLAACRIPDRHHRADDEGDRRREKEPDSCRLAVNETHDRRQKKQPSLDLQDPAEYKN